MPRKQRNRIIRLDGKPIHLVAKRAHLMVCAKGCCCGRTERGFAGVPVDFYKAEYKKRKIRKLVQLTMSGCLGPCPVANVALLVLRRASGLVSVDQRRTADQSDL